MYIVVYPIFSKKKKKRTAYWHANNLIDEVDILLPKLIHLFACILFASSVVVV